MILKLAWRNIWRSKRRTLITVASILFAVLFASFMEAFQKGAWNHMINNVVNFYFGYAQVHQAGYWEEQSLDKAFILDGQSANWASEIPEIKGVVPRLESFGLASTGDRTMGALVVGIEPEAENGMTKLNDRLVEGTYLEGNDVAVLVAEGMMKNLRLELNDTLVLVSQGYHGVNAAGKYPIKGVVRFGSPELNKQMVYLPLKEAQWFYGAEGLVTSLALNIDNQDDTPAAVKALKARLNMEEYEVMDWKEMLPDLIKAKALDSAGNYIVYFVLYLIIAFGIFGTILMMTKEREYEFGVLVAIGMQRLKLSAIVWVEAILLGVIGAICGIIVSIPLVWYFHLNPIRFSGDYAGTMEKFGFEPIFPAELDPKIFLTQAMVVFVLTALLAVYPMFKIRSMEPVEAMRA